MSGPTEPQWDLLPDHPEQFFSLSGDYDLRDLKRSYSKLIRKYKPEKFPEEFQKIRAAFEWLNDALRYGETRNFETLDPDQLFNWNQSESAPGHHDPDAPIFEDDLPHQSEQKAENQTAGPSIAERIRQESIPRLYTELANQEHKTPYDYYALAVLSDLLPDAERSFPYWLLEGLKTYREEPALFELLHQHFVTCHEIEELEDLLEATSRVIRSDRFYYLTEAAWDRLIREKPFEQFQQTLESCELYLLDHQVDHKLVFYLHILKPAVWKADVDWIDMIISEIEDQYDHMSFWLEEEYEFIYLVRLYQQQRSKFLNSGPEQVMIDQAIVDYCLQHEQDADRCFLQYQQALVSHETPFKNFKLNDQEFNVLASLWSKIASDVHDRITLDQDPLENELLDQRAYRLASRMLTEGAGKQFKLTHDAISFILGLVLFGSLGLGIYFVSSLFESFWMTLLQLGGLLLFFIVSIGISVFAINRFVKKYYRRWWRYEIMNFYQQNWFPLDALVDELEQLGTLDIRGNKYEGLDGIAGQMRKDQGLWFYITAQQLLNACQ